MKIKLVQVLALVLMFSQVTYAGAGAHVYACVNVAVVSTPFEVKFTRSGFHCMYETGNDKSIEVKEVGITCADIGYVEAKASSSDGDVCATDLSHWHLNYVVPGTNHGGSADLNLKHPALDHNYGSFHSRNENAYMCSAPVPCRTTEQQWDSGTVGDLYIVFDPH